MDDLIKGEIYHYVRKEVDKMNDDIEVEMAFLEYEYERLRRSHPSVSNRDAAMSTIRDRMEDLERLRRKGAECDCPTPIICEHFGCVPLTYVKRASKWQRFKSYIRKLLA